MKKMYFKEIPLDLHTINHPDVPHLVENYVLCRQNSFPLKIITGDSDKMKSWFFARGKKICNRGKIESLHRNAAELTTMADNKIRNMEEFASVSGISRPTVSKYFNDPSSVRPSTRSRIEAALELHDYRPNIYAMYQNRKLKNIS